MIAYGYHDTRVMRFDLPDGLPEHRTPEHRTPKGQRPIQPTALKITYSLSHPSGRTHIHVELLGRKLRNDGRYGSTMTIGDVTRRTSDTPYKWGRPSSTPATFDELGLPEWARPYIEDNRPAWCPASGGSRALPSEPPSEERRDG